MHSVDITTSGLPFAYLISHNSLAEFLLKLVQEVCNKFTEWNLYCREFDHLNN